MAAIALRPLAINFLDLLAGSNCEVEEFQLRSDTTRCAAIDGRSLTELDLGRRTNGALVLAIQGRSGLIANPNGSTRLEAGQRLIVMGSPSQLQEMERLLGEALEDASVLKA